ncbi:MAG: hypothetical protein LIP00_12760 [Parabacteroides sp.]|nr:hypothetical protein [Parabacteroides sp.]
MCWLVSALGAGSQEFQRLSTSGGESYLSIRAIAQDRMGIIWFATFSGLYRYTGGEYIEKVPLSDTMDSDLTCLLVDEQGAVWIGSNREIYRYDPHKEKIAAVTSCTRTLKVRALCTDGAGGIYAGTKEQGLFHYNPLTASLDKVYSLDGQDLSFMYIRSLLLDGRGNLWIGTLYDGVYYCKIHAGGKTGNT